MRLSCTAFQRNTVFIFVVIKAGQQQEIFDRLAAILLYVVICLPFLSVVSHVNFVRFIPNLQLKNQ